MTTHHNITFELYLSVQTVISGHVGQRLTGTGC